MIDAALTVDALVTRLVTFAFAAYLVSVPSASLLLMFFAWRPPEAASSELEYLKPSVCLRRLLLPLGLEETRFLLQQCHPSAVLGAL